MNAHLCGINHLFLLLVCVDYTPVCWILLCYCQHKSNLSQWEDQHATRTAAGEQNRNPSVFSKGEVAHIETWHGYDFQIEVENFVLKMAAEFPSRRDQLIFLINNYDMMLNVLMVRLLTYHTARNGHKYMNMFSKYNTKYLSWNGSKWNTKYCVEFYFI